MAEIALVNTKQIKSYHSLNMKANDNRALYFGGRTMNFSSKKCVHRVGVQPGASIAMVPKYGVRISSRSLEDLCLAL